MSGKVEAGDKVIYIPKGGSVAGTRTGVARSDEKTSGIPFLTEHTTAKVTDSKTGEDVGERVAWKK